MFTSNLSQIILIAILKCAFDNFSSTSTDVLAFNFIRFLDLFITFTTLAKQQSNKKPLLHRLFLPQTELLSAFLTVRPVKRDLPVTQWLCNSHLIGFCYTISINGKQIDKTKDLDV